MFLYVVGIRVAFDSHSSSRSLDWFVFNSYRISTYSNSIRIRLQHITVRIRLGFDYEVFRIDLDFSTMIYHSIGICNVLAHAFDHYASVLPKYSRGVPLCVEAPNHLVCIWLAFPSVRLVVEWNAIISPTFSINGFEISKIEDLWRFGFWGTSGALQPCSLEALELSNPGSPPPWNLGVLVSWPCLSESWGSGALKTWNP